METVRSADSAVEVTVYTQTCIMDIVTVRQRGTEEREKPLYDSKHLGQG